MSSLLVALSPERITKDDDFRAVVVAQLVERTLPIPEIRASNPDIVEILPTNCTIEKTKIEKKKPGLAHL